MQTLTTLGKNLSPENPGLPPLGTSCVTRAPLLLSSYESHTYIANSIYLSLPRPDEIGINSYEEFREKSYTSNSRRYI